MSKRIDTLVAAAEKVFGEQVQKVTAPGGKSRSSYRLFFEDRSVIATWRPNFRRTHLEAYALKALSEVCDDTPTFLGLDGEILFQSDVGSRRLNAEMARSNKQRKRHLAEEAVASIFRIQMASRQTDLAEIMPHLGTADDWFDNFVGSVDVFNHFGPGLPDTFDADAAKSALTVPCTQFVKWDCRSGNAALDADDHMRWFDFEYAGLRHGAEDLAWLIGDEAWPLAAEDMLAIVKDAYPAKSEQNWGTYEAYMSLYTTFHALQRFQLIVREAGKRGWIPRQKTLTYDDAGVHPTYAAHICAVGAFFADRNPETRMLVTNFLDTADIFVKMVVDANEGQAV